MKNRIRIFVSAYACEPGLGSEIGVGWHWVLEMSRRFELWVLTRESNRRTIEPWIATHPEFAGIHFLYFDLPAWARRWKRGMRGVRLYYNLWQLASNGIVRRTMRREGIRAFHHLTYGNALWPVSRYGRRQFFVWGPVSAGVMLPRSFTLHFRPMARAKEAAQRMAARLLRANAGFRRRCRMADLILCKTDATMAAVPRRDRGKCRQFTDVAVEYADTGQYQSAQPRDGGFTYVAAGTLVGWRCFDVLILAFAEARKRRGDIRLRIVGDGNDRRRLERLIAEAGVEDCVELLGQLPMDGYRREVAGADVVVNPCLREGAVTVSFDSMNFSKPLICFDTGGYTHYFAEDYSCVIPAPSSREAAVEALAEKIAWMADAGRIARMGAAAHEAGKLYSWERKGELIAETIAEAYGEWEKKQDGNGR